MVSLVTGHGLAMEHDHPYAMEAVVHIRPANLSAYILVGLLCTQTDGEPSSGRAPGASPAFSARSPETDRASWSHTGLHSLHHRARHLRSVYMVYQLYLRTGSRHCHPGVALQVRLRWRSLAFWVMPS